MPGETKNCRSSGPRRSSTLAPGPCCKAPPDRLHHRRSGERRHRSARPLIDAGSATRVGSMETQVTPALRPPRMSRSAGVDPDSSRAPCAATNATRRTRPPGSVDAAPTFPAWTRFQDRRRTARHRPPPLRCRCPRRRLVAYVVAMSVSDAEVRDAVGQDRSGLRRARLTSDRRGSVQEVRLANDLHVPSQGSPVVVKMRATSRIS